MWNKSVLLLSLMPKLLSNRILSTASDITLYYCHNLLSTYFHSFWQIHVTFLWISRNSGCIIRSPNTVCITTLPCKNWQLTFCYKRGFQTFSVEHCTLIKNMCECTGSSSKKLMVGKLFHLLARIRSEVKITRICLVSKHMLTWVNSEQDFTLHFHKPC